MVLVRDAGIAAVWGGEEGESALYPTHQSPMVFVDGWGSPRGPPTGWDVAGM